MTTIGGSPQLFTVPRPDNNPNSIKKKKPKKPKTGTPSNPPQKKSFVVKTFRDNSDMSSEDEEEEEEYKKGGYHPVEIGNVFNSKYKVTAKLGWGHFSTVWLAAELNSERVVALKIVKSAQHYTEAARDEINILQTTTKEDPNNNSCVIHLIDSFEICGVNGYHVAMAFEKLGCNLLTLIRMYKYRGLPIPLVRMMTRQMMIGVEFLHRCQIIHTDLKPENLLMVKTPNIVKRRGKRRDNHPVEEDHHRVPGEKTLLSPDPREGEEEQEGQDVEKATEEREKPDSMVVSKPESKSTDQMPTTKEELVATFGDCYQIKIVDLGNACWTHKHFTDDVQTRQYRAPEVILGAKYDTAIDIWSIACIVFELLTGDLLFEPKSGKTFDKNDDHLAQMQELLGKMPKSVSLTGKNTGKFFNRHGDLRTIKNLRTWKLKDVLLEKYKFSQKDATEVSDFLLPMLNMSPRDRATASAMLEHPWIKDINVKDFSTAFN